ncbi:ABC transporter substrate-binding protein [Cryptosporangium phraense]|uniref:ABC transporter substrate-binding protein n=1 Tax=Cryptosporangium phraense TaxID=2593070 RepID=UPI0014795547|nr:ABC transporter substrate-binding protein [Cryptosporangium phraense]
MKLRSTRVAGLAVAVAASLILAACGGSDTDSSSSSSAAPAGPFEFKDARGKTVTIEKTPTTVVAQSSVAAALWDAGFQVKGAYGELTPDAGGKLSFQAGNLDLKKVDVIGKTYGEFDTEKYALLDPQLLIDYTYDAKALWYVPQAQADRVEKLAPTLAVPGNYQTTDEAIQTFVDLAGKLGADTGSDALKTAKTRYDTALKDISAVAKTSGLKVAIMSPGKDSLYVVKPAMVPEGNTLKAQGLDLMDATGKSKDTDVFAQQSWEEAPTYKDADVILVDARTYEGSKADLAKVATWANLPAVKAGQVYPWYAAAPYSYASYAKIYAELAADLKAAKKL